MFSSLSLSSRQHIEEKNINKYNTNYHPARLCAASSARSLISVRTNFLITENNHKTKLCATTRKTANKKESRMFLIINYYYYCYQRHRHDTRWWHTKHPISCVCLCLWETIVAQHMDAMPNRRGCMSSRSLDSDTWCPIHFAQRNWRPLCKSFYSIRCVYVDLAWRRAGFWTTHAQSGHGLAEKKKKKRKMRDVAHWLHSLLAVCLVLVALLLLMQ